MWNPYQRAYRDITPSRTLTWLEEPGRRPLRAHVYAPEGWQADDRRTGVVIYFGGGWTIGSVWQFAPVAQALADAGAVVFVPEYRIKLRDRSSVADSLRDAKAFLAWLAPRARGFGVDERAFVLSGASAGGHLAASATTLTTTDDPLGGLDAPIDPAAMMLINPAVNFTIEPSWYATYSPRQKIAARLMSRLSELDPMRALSERFPPTLLLHGDRDQLVPLHRVEEFAGALSDLGVQAHLEVFPGRGHAFFNRLLSPEDSAATIRSAIGFLAGQGLLSAQ